MNKEKLIILIAVLVVIAGFSYWYFVFREKATRSPLLDAEESQSLGEQIFEEAQNPIEGGVPTLDTVVNPLEDVYKNPFE